MGIHGVRPLTEEETAVYKLSSKVEAYLASLDGLPDETAEEVDQLRRYYCAWCDDSEIGEDIQPHHQECIAWLGCEDSC